MRKIVLSAVMAATAFTAMPAQAQVWRLQPSIHRQIQSDINQLDNRIDRAARRGTISRREATSLNRQANRLQRLYNRYSRNGLTRPEVEELEVQVNRLHQQLRHERRDWDGRRG